MMLHGAAFAILFGPFLVACLCLLVSVVYLARMLFHLRPDRKALATVLGPFALLSEQFYTPTGRPLQRQCKRWFRRFALWLLGWGVLALLGIATTRIAKVVA